MVAGELEVLTSTYPLRERLWGLRALALTRSGRQADALEVLRQVRELLAERARPRTRCGAARPPDRRAPAGPRPGLGRAVEPAACSRHAAHRVGLAAGRTRRPARCTRRPARAVRGRSPSSQWSPATRASARAACVRSSRRSPSRRVRRSSWAAAPRTRAPHRSTPGPRCSPSWDTSCPSDAGAAGTEDSSSRFRAWEAIARTVLDAARDQHLLVVLDDLHWADTSTLRVLRLLAESADDGRLMVVATWRHEPAPTGLLAEVAETLARRHALRLQLSGLTVEEAGEIVDLGGGDRTHRDRGGRPAAAHRREPVLPGGVRPARP